MLNQISHMTKDEKKATLNHIQFLDEACKVDNDEVFRAMSEYNIFINDLIHFNMMKCEVLQDTGMPIIPFTAEDYKKFASKIPRKKAAKFCVKF